MEQEFYDQAALSEFDSAIEQFAAKLRECVRDEWVEEMARLREENAKYADIKARWAEIEAERQRERAEVERVKKDAKLQAQYARMEELWGNACVEIFKPTFVFPDRYCGKNVYAPQSLSACKAKMNNYYCQKNSLTVWYKIPHRDGDYLQVVEAFDDETSFERINRVNAFFKSRERCQAFCNWLNGEGDEGV